MSKNRLTFGLIQDHNIVYGTAVSKNNSANDAETSSNIEGNKSFVNDLNKERGSGEIQLLKRSVSNQRFKKLII
jgi:hypothetical protein